MNEEFHLDIPMEPAKGEMVTSIYGQVMSSNFVDMRPGRMVFAVEVIPDDPLARFLHFTVTEIWEIEVVE